MKMDRLEILTKKLIQLNKHVNDRSLEVIDIDLVLDYVRVVYADLLELRSKISSNNINTDNQNSDDERSGEGEKVLQNSIVLETPNSSQNSPEIIEKSISDSQPIFNSKESKSIVVEKIQTESTSFLDKVLESKQSKKRDIRQLITINDKFLFMSELFNNDKFDYESALDILNGFSTYNEAENWLEETYFSTNTWNKENQIVVTLLNTIQSMFK